MFKKVIDILKVKKSGPTCRHPHGGSKMKGSYRGKSRGVKGPSKSLPAAENLPAGETAGLRVKIFRLFFLASLCLWFCLSLFSGEAFALGLQLDEAELKSGADKIITGEVIETGSHWNEQKDSIYTKVEVFVEETHKGDSKTEVVTVIVPGGEVEGISQFVSDAPEFAPGEKARLYLTKKDDSSQVNGPGLAGLDEHYEIYGGHSGKATLQEAEEEELSPAGSNEFVWLGIRWPGSSPVVPYRVNATFSQTAAIRAAAETWSEAGANFSFSYAGSHNRTGRAALNGVNEVLFYNLGTNRALAVATMWFSDGIILEADITFNTLFRWSTGSFSSTYNDVETIALHEFGHALGLDHSPNPFAVMYGFISGVRRDLHPADIAGIHYIYGTTGEEPEEEDPFEEDPEEDEPEDEDPENDGDNDEKDEEKDDDPGEDEKDEEEKEDRDEDKEEEEKDEETEEDEETEHEVTLAARPYGAGATEGGGVFEPGDEVSIKATPAEGFLFCSWVENGREVSTSSTYNFTIESCRHLTAKFLTETPASGRLAGDDRYETALEVSRAGFPGGAETVLIARGDNFPDSLAGAPLAHALQAPILLTEPESLPDKIEAEIEDLGAEKAVILGGEAAVSGKVAETLEKMGLSVKRIWGEDRYETAEAIALKLAETTGEAPGGSYLVLGDDFPDALAAAPYAAARGYPVLLLKEDSLPAATMRAIRETGIRDAVMMGGEELISDRVRMDLWLQRVSVSRIEGNDRYQRMLNLAEEEMAAGSKDLFIATGENYPDALTGGVLAARHNSGILLVPGSESKLQDETKEFIADNGFNSWAIFGGPAAVEKAIENEVAELLK